MSPEVNAHAVTLKFHRFLSPDEWREVLAVVRGAPHVVEVEMTAVEETPEELARRQRRTP
jgi:hypothetical protein